MAILVFIIIVPLAMIIIGLIFRTNLKEETRRKGVRWLQWGAIWFVSEVLIGYAICSTMKPTSFH